MSAVEDAATTRMIVGRWLRIRADHCAESYGVGEHVLPKDKQHPLLTQLAADAEHSDLLLRLLNGEEPLPFDAWKKRYQR